MIKENETNLKKLEGLVNVIARNVAEIKDEMATKKDIVDIRAEMATKKDLADLEMAMKDNLYAVERRLSAKIETVDEKVDLLEEIDVRDIQRRVTVLEKNVKVLKHKHA